MGNDWGEIGRGGKPNWGYVITFLIILIITVSLVRCAPSETRIPRPVTTPGKSPTVPSAVLSPAPSPIPRPERSPHKPTSQSRVIYVVNNVNSFWHVKDALSGWKSAKYTDFKLAQTCPIAAPCVTVKLNKTLAADTAAVTTFTTSPYVIYMDLNPAVTNEQEAENTVSHEFGHVLGAPHIVGTLNTVMSPIGVYRLLPTKLDIQTVDRLGHWEAEKMYENSGKTLDMRRLPN